MARVAKINLVKALSLKNEITGKLANLKGKVYQNNSYNVDNKPNYNSREIFDEVQLLSAKLVDLKTKIALANKKIQPLIFELSELKDQITTLEHLDTKEGTFKVNASVEVVEQVFETFISEIDKDNIISGIKEKISEIQDKLAIHNYKTKIAFTV